MEIQNYVFLQVRPQNHVMHLVLNLLRLVWLVTSKIEWSNPTLGRLVVSDLRSKNPKVPGLSPASSYVQK